MDLFNRGKSKAKKKADQPAIQTTISTPFTNTPHSPKSPVLHPNDDYASGVGRLVEGSSSIRSSQSSSIPSTDAEYTNVDTMTEAEIEDFFEKMLTRRGINSNSDRLKMLSFPIDKKRLMVGQDIQFENNVVASPSSRRTGVDKKLDHHQTENKGPEYYVRKLSDMSKGVNTKVVAHLAVGLRTMPLSWVRQFIDMQGLQVITALLKAFNKNKQRQELSLSVEADLLKCFKALLNNRASITMEPYILLSSNILYYLGGSARSNETSTMCRTNRPLHRLPIHQFTSTRL
ncbi:diaphanous GTPase-binding domain-containing protein [Mucor mucedo]|uniref:diaphanous GTPase-binding domain-containing protein n=1 Tax=Mucor mucedo TaxID=29922 RepID=UPI002220B822|nr:diaphanous GTPase-binding domain-containing protein [Mucor mucedo]KAI7889321.1 diaphanous GTPase-binding domain-containing protein [Mucor mucedo]